MGDRENTVRSLGLLRILTASSAVIGILMCVSSGAYFVNLHNNEEYGYGNETVTEGCKSLYPPDERFCQFLRTWGNCSLTSVIIVGIQVLMSIVALVFRSITPKTNLVCAAHGLAFVSLLPIFILSLSYFFHPAIDAQNKLEILFILVTGVDMLFSLFFVITISLVYGMEAKTLYMRLDSNVH